VDGSTQILAILAGVIAARSQDKGRALVERPGARVFYVHADITRDDDLQRLVDRAVAAFGRIDFIINNACSYVDEGQRSTRAQWLTTLDTNLVSGGATRRACALGAGEDKRVTFTRVCSPSARSWDACESCRPRLFFSGAGAIPR